MTTSASSTRDPHTFSNYDLFKTTHTQANLWIDFDKRVVSGNVVLSLKSTSNASSEEVVLDTSHLNIEDIKVNQKSCEWDMQPRTEPFGSPLKIKLDKAVDEGETFEVDVSQA